MRAVLLVLLMATAANAAQVAKIDGRRTWIVWSDVGGFEGSFRGTMSARRLTGVLSDVQDIPYAVECRLPRGPVDGGPTLWRSCRMAALWEDGRGWREIGALMIPAGGGL